MKNGRALGKPIPADKRRASIHELEIGHRYALQIVPITNQVGCNPFQIGEG